jgi:hypothetical protein
MGHIWQPENTIVGQPSNQILILAPLEIKGKSKGLHIGFYGNIVL